METSSNSSSNSNNGFCKYCNVELNRENTSKVGRKSCITCNKTRLDKCKAEKQPQAGKISCSRCKKYFDLTKILKQVKQCTDCRSKQTEIRRAKNGSVSSLEDGDNGSYNNNVIDIVELFNFLKSKHPTIISYTLEDVINEIQEAQEEETESGTDTETQDN